MVYKNESKKERIWNLGGSEIGDVEEYKHLGVTVKAGLNSDFKSMVDVNGVLLYEEDLMSEIG